MAQASTNRSVFLYDHLKVVGLWHITNKSREERYEAAKSRERDKLTEDAKGAKKMDLCIRYGFSKEYCDIITQLSSGSLNSSIGEVFLLHATDPTNLHNILFEGLDPEVAKNGNFGRGVYFAENAAKIDQYARVDKRFDSEGLLSELHDRIYSCSNRKHPHNVRYALVSKVILGNHVTTKDGKTQLMKTGDYQKDAAKGRILFRDKTKTELSDLEDSSTPSSLIGLPGKKLHIIEKDLSAIVDSKLAKGPCRKTVSIKAVQFISAEELTRMMRKED
eukprot:15330566-Ditylum_brightwellii.AAC.1